MNKPEVRTNKEQFTSEVFKIKISFVRFWTFRH